MIAPRRDQGAVSDEIELKMVDKLLAKYQEKGMVPIGNYWVPTPPQIRQAASANTDVVRPDSEVVRPTTKKPPILVIGVVVVGLLLFGFMFFRNISNKGAKANPTGTGTPQATLTVTPLRSPTPTPLALDAQDSIIRGGDTSGSGPYPVNLRVVNSQEVQPRVFVVQRRLIQTTEWNFEDNPDTASYLSGLIIRPVLGIPWSVDNAALFDAMGKETSFILQMNTGASMRFEFSARNVVNRSDVGLFQQASPGLVLVLIGQRDQETDEATPNRIVVLANYAPDQELSSGVLTSLDVPKMDTPTPTLMPTPVERVDIQVITVTTDLGRASVRLRIYNGRYTNISIDSQSLWIIYGYTAQPVGPRMAAEIHPFVLEPNQAAELTVTFAWHGEPYALLGAFDNYQFAVKFKGVSS